MHQIFDISFLDELGDEVSHSQIKSELDITCESEVNEQSDTSTQEALDGTLADKSHGRYGSAYEALIKWQQSKQVSSFAEPVLLDYFHELSEKYKPSSLWSTYSMVKSTLNSNHDINISGYSRLSAFLKEKAYGFQSKKSKVFTADDINKFLTEAPDYKYLAMKTVLVLGTIGVSSKQNIINVKIDHVKDNGNEIIVRIRDPKTKVLMEHVIVGKFAEIVRKYMKLRPRTARTDRFLMQYRDGKCINQVMGGSFVAKTPKEVAIFLRLPESETYTAYSFRSTSTTFSDYTSFAIDTVKQHEEQRCSRVTGGQVQESLGHNRQIDSLIAEETDLSSTRSDVIASNENGSDRIATDTTTRSESSQHVAATDILDNNSASDSEAPRRKRKKRPKRQNEVNWYDEECLAQIKLTTDMFKRFSKMAEDDKMKILSEFSMHRVELFQKYFAAMNAVAINPINTAKTVASINNSAQSGRMANSDFVILKVNSLANTNGLNEP